VLVVVFYLGASGRHFLGAGVRHFLGAGACHFLGAGRRAEQQCPSKRVDGGRNDQR
jgi:hypothetical protein